MKTCNLCRGPGCLPHTQPGVTGIKFHRCPACLGFGCLARDGSAIKPTTDNKSHSHKETP